MTHVVILGAGRLGQALTRVLRASTHAVVSLWDHNPELVPEQLPLETSVPNADVLLFAVPTSNLRDAIALTLPNVRSGCVMGIFSKGLEPVSAMSSAEIADEAIDGNASWAVIGGPMMAEDLHAGLTGQAVVAGPGAHRLESLMKDIVATHDITFTTAKHPRDVSLSGVVKNLYAFLYGAGEGLDLPPTDLRRLWDRCEQEMMKAATVCGIDRRIMGGLAGIGDFRGTAGSPHSRNRQAGARLSARHELNPNAESVRSTELMLNRWTKLRTLPCLAAVDQLMNHAPAADVLERLLQA